MRPAVLVFCLVGYLICLPVLGLSVYQDSIFSDIKSYRDLNPNVAIDKINELITLAEREERGNVMHLLHNELSVAYTNISDHEQAIGYGLLALEGAEQFQDTLAVIDANHNIGIIFYYEGQFDEALTYFENAMALSNMINEPARIGNSLINIGLIYGEKGESDKEEQHYLEARKYFLEMNNLDGLATVALNLGELYRTQDRFDEAEELLNSSLQMFQHLEYRLGIVEIYSSLAELYLQIGRIEEGMSIARQGISMAKENSYSYDLLFFYELLKKYYAGIGDFENAFNIFVEYQVIADSIFSEAKSKQVLELETIYQTTKKEFEIDQLKTEQELATSRIEQVETQRTYLVIIMVLISLSAGLLFYQYRQIKTDRQTILIQSKQLEKHVEAKEKVFGIIAHDLKGPLSALTNMAGLMAMNLSKLPQEQAQTYLANMERGAKNLGNLLNNLLEWSFLDKGMMSPKPEAVILKDAVAKTFDLLRDMAMLKQINLTFRVEELSIMVDRNHLNTILRNLISNAIKFTESNGKVEVYSESKDGQISIHIADNGIGMTPDEVKKLFREETDINTIGDSEEKGTGLGLLLCKELNVRNKGSYQITSEPGKGTTFSITLPQAT